MSDRCLANDSQVFENNSCGPPLSKAIIDLRITFTSTLIAPMILQQVSRLLKDSLHASFFMHFRTHLYIDRDGGYYIEWKPLFRNTISIECHFVAP